MATVKHPTKYPGIFKYELKTKPGSFYLVRYRNDRGRSTDKNGFKTLAAARAWQTDNTVSLRDGSYVAPSDGRTPVEEIVKDLLATKAPTWRKTYLAQWKSCWRARIRDEFGSLPVGQVTERYIQDWINELHGIGLAPKTCRNYLNCLSGILEHAVRSGAISKNETAKVTIPRKGLKRPRRYLTEAQVRLIANTLDGMHRAMFLTLVYTGLRWGELAGLEVGSVNLNSRRITVRRSVGRIREKGGGWQIGPPKNGKERRVGFPPHIADELRPFLAGKTRTDLVFPPSGTTEFMDPPSIPQPGRAPSPITNWLWIACDDNGIEPVTAHELRHTYASLAVSNGANVNALMRGLGHARASLTLDVYSDLFEEDIDAVADRMGASWDTPVRSVPPAEGGEPPALTLVR